MRLQIERRRAYQRAYVIENRKVLRLPTGACRRASFVFESNEKFVAHAGIVRQLQCIPLSRVHFIQRVEDAQFQMNPGS